MAMSPHSPTMSYSVSRLSPAHIERELKGKNYVPNEVLIAVDQKAIDSFSLSSHGLTLASQYDGFLRASVSDGESLSAKLAELRSTPGVKAADVNSIIERGEMETSEQGPSERLPDDLHEQLWGLKNTGRQGGTPGADMKVTQAWSEVTGSRETGPVIAVIDTGVDITHPDLAANIWTNPGEIPGNGVDDDGNGVIDDVHGYNAADDNADVMDRRGHGTHVAGTIGAVGDNGMGVVGVNWQTRIMPVKIFDDNGRATVDGIVRGLQYAKNEGASVSNNSWGSRGYNEVLDAAFGAADNMIHVVAAGNDGRNIDLGGAYPAALAHKHIVTVGATDRNDQRPEWSNYGRYNVDVTAPGHQIYSTWPGGTYKSISGTSMATPHVAGAVSLLKQKFPQATAAEIKSRLIHTSDFKPELQSNSVSGGRVNLMQAMEEDRVPPAAPNDLGISRMDAETYSVSWTVTGDDGWCGDGASQFEYKVSQTPIESQEQFDALPNRTSSRNLKKVGEIMTLEQSRPQTADATTLYAALRVIDNVGNTSEIKKTTLEIPGFDVVFEDDMEVKGNWTPDEVFGTEQVEGRGTVWSDSPGRDYENNANSTLTSKFIDLTNYEACAMQVEYKVDVAAGDHGFVEWSEDGERWHVISQVFAQDREFRATKFDLAEVSGKKAAFRFRLRSDAQNTRDGMKIDRVRIIGVPSPAA